MDPRRVVPPSQPADGARLVRVERLRRQVEEAESKLDYKDKPRQESAWGAGATCLALLGSLLVGVAVAWALAELYPDVMPHPVKGLKATADAATNAAGSSLLAASMGKKAAGTGGFPYDDGQLKLAVVLYAHGDATPDEKFPFEEFNWPEGLGQLTRDGMAEAYAFGRTLHERYVRDEHLLNSTYDPNFEAVKVATVDKDAAVDAARAAVLGIFPPHDMDSFQFGETGRVTKKARVPHVNPSAADCTCRGRQEITSLGRKGSKKVFAPHRASYKCIAKCVGVQYENVDVNPAGVQDVLVLATRRVRADYMFRQGDVCYWAKNLTRATAETAEWQKKTREFGRLLENVRRITGCPERDVTPEYSKNCLLCPNEPQADGTRMTKCTEIQLDQLEVVADHLRAAIRHDMPWPRHAGPKKQLLADIERATSWMFWHRYRPLKEGREKGGFLLGDLMHRIEGAIDRDARESFVFYSVEPQALSNLLEAMNARTPRIPEHGDRIVVELRDTTQRRGGAYGRKTSSLRGAAYPASEATWSVSVFHNTDRVNIFGCPNGKCTWPRFRSSARGGTVRLDGRLVYGDGTFHGGDIDAFKRSQDGLIVADEMASVCGGIEAFKAR